MCDVVWGGKPPPLYRIYFYMEICWSFENGYGKIIRDGTMVLLNICYYVMILEQFIININRCSF